MKKKWGAIGGSAALFGMALSRWAREHYGINGSLIIAAACLVIVIAVLVIGAYMTKKYFEVMMAFFMLSPLVVTFIGMYLQNIYIILGGLILLAISSKFMVKKVAPWLKNRK